MDDRFDAATRDLLRTAREVSIFTRRRPDQAVIIWVVVSGNGVFVRSVRGAQGKWYKTAAADGQAVLGIGDRRIPIRLTAVAGDAANAAVSAEYLRKYADSPYAQSMVRPDVLPTTLQLAPA